MEGMLWKAGQINTAWKHRRFVLAPGEQRLSYHAPSGRKDIALPGIAEVRPAAQPGECSRAHGFLVVTKGRTYKLAAASEAERAAWVAAIAAACSPTTATPPGPIATTATTTTTTTSTTATAPPPTATSSSPSSFPSRAISLAHLFSLLDGKTIDAAWTAHEVKINHVLPVTLATTTAYTDSPAGKEHSGETNVFVSHAWQYTFGSLVGALRNWATKTGADAATTYAWIDLFSVNQHVSQDVTQDEWAETFKNGIAKAGRVVLVLTPWSNPIPYTRAWCLWEVFNASKTGARFEIALSSDEEQRLGDAVSEEPFGIVPALCEISSSKAEAQDPRDKEMIFSWITRPTAEGGAGGFRALDGLMLDLLREWLATVLAQLKQERAPDGEWEGDEGMVTFRTSLALAYNALGQPHDALQLEEGIVEAAKRLFGPEEDRTLVVTTNLANTYGALGQIDRAYEQHAAVLATRRRLGHNPEVVADCLCNAAIASAALGRFDDSLSARKEVLAMRLASGSGDSDELVLRAQQSLGNAYTDAGMHDEALDMQERSLAGYRALHPPPSVHPDVLSAMHNLAVTYTDLGRHQESALLKQETFDVMRAAFGPDHPDTLVAASNLAVTLADVGRVDDAIALEEGTLRRKINGGGAPVGMVMSMANLAAHYCDAERLEEAGELGLDALRLAQESLPPGHPHTFRILEGISRVAFQFATVNRFEEALALTQRAAPAVSREVEPDHELAERFAEFDEHFRFMLE